MDFQKFKSKFQLEEVEEYPNQVSLKPMLSVLVLTHNQKDYIRECLDSILKQKIDFDLEIIIGEDDSKDGTREICMEYADKHPDKIRLLLHSKKNKVTFKKSPPHSFNSFYGLFSARGKYIAICEGDDYWTDSEKLQKQLNYLESNPDCSLSYHPTLCFDELDPSVRFFKQPKQPDQSRKFDVEEYIKGKGLGVWTVSMVGKAEYFKEIPEWLLQAPITDLAIKLYYAHHGKIGYLTDCMAVYRRRSKGSWSEFSHSYDWQIDHMKDRTKTYNLFNEISDRKFEKEIQASNEWWKIYCLGKAFNHANRKQRRKLIFDYPSFFLNLKKRENIIRFAKFVIGDR